MFFLHLFCHFKKINYFCTTNKNVLTLEQYKRLTITLNKIMRDFENLKIAVAGTGYVGLSIATLLAQHHQVTAVDVIPEKVEKINNRVSPIQDEYIEKYLKDSSILPCVGETGTG